jgi:DNA polymerase kappa
MLCTSNYEARKFGVRSAMPGYIALKLCPQLKIVPLNFAKYRAASAKVRSVFEQYDPHFCPMSLDEVITPPFDSAISNGL